MARQNLNFLNWNVRGLNNWAKRTMVRDTVLTSLAAVVCFQEAKLDVINNTLVMKTLGPAFDGFCYLPATQTRGAPF